MSLARLAELYGVAISYESSPGQTVRVADAAVVAALAALGVDAGSPEAAEAALHAREAELAERLLPPTVVWWQGRDPAALAGLPEGTRLRVETEQGRTHAWTTTAPTGPPSGNGGRANGTSDSGVSGSGTSGSDASERNGRRGGRAPRGTSGNGTSGDRTPGNGAQRNGEAPQDVPGGGAPPALPPGVHTLTAAAPDGRRARVHLVVAPERMPGPRGERVHGLLLQLYSLLSERSWGMGDLGDLAELAAWAGHVMGSGFVQVNPLHVAVPAVPSDPSPYRPSSRYVADPVHLRIEKVHEYAYLDLKDRTEIAETLERAAALRGEVLRDGALIDRDAVWALKRRALEVLIARVPLSPGRRAAYNAFLAAGGRHLEDHATWSALADVHGPDWHGWPEGLRDPRSPETARARVELLDLVDFHSRLAWLADCQLAAAQRTARAAGMPVGLVHDLAVGVHPNGSDAWAQQEHLAPGMSVGAPPDAFNARGQDWGLPPWRPDRLAASGYAPYRALLRAMFRHAGGLRIDHVMGLFRLWWVPQGKEPTQGTYVHYDADAMLAVLSLEAHRTGALVIGEDLGTVAPGVRRTLRGHGMLGTSVLWFERDWEGDGQPLPPERWRTDCLATATTHDLPPTSARLTGEHVALRHGLGLLTRPLAEEQAVAAEEAAEWLELLGRLGMLEDGTSGGVATGKRGGDASAEDFQFAGDEERIRAVYRFLLRTPARLIGVWLPDMIGDRRPQNLPGTWREYPNWRLPIADADGRPVTLEQLTSSRRLHALLKVLRGER
ncbi:4-alpha-glucanotransferase [Streptomyces sp. TS71-3]|uniref:4-alpha-glucanotransferase n=1 Tax=Streptomyces sp. TS71-3 TaxID=2733862 RepID=UPI001B03B4DC|nr:4-alpha-glucanotransferase [Streptomyces sp. TS71-3]GHJ37575.1 4-alpha-glucanotransferase [Streptomyces sp. TS71-3]